MTAWLKQSTAVTLLIGPFLDETDGKTAETGLTISQGDVRLSKNGGNMAQKNESTACTHDEIGMYTCPLDATDTNTLGILQVCVHESGALPVFATYMVVPANVWDSMFGSDMLKVDVHSIDDDETAADNLELACDNYSATRGLAGTALPAAAADAAGGLPISDAGGLDLDAQVKTAVDAIKAKTDSLTFTVAGDVDCNVQTWKGSAAADMTGDAYARLGAPAGASVSADVAAVKAVDDAIKAKTDNLPASPAATGAAMTLADDAITAATFDESTAFPLKSADTGATAVARTGADYDTLETLSDEIAAVTAPTAAAVADAVWDEAVADHAGVGSTGAALAAAGGSGDPWATALPGAYGAGTAGKIVGDNLNATVSSRSSHDAAAVKTAIEAAGSHLALIKAKTDNLPADPADDSDIDTQLAAIAGYLDTEVAAILAAVDTEVAAIKAKTDNLPASPAATGAQMDLVNAPNATAIAAIKTAMEAGGSTLATLLSRIVGTLAAGTHSAQSGDAYAVVNSGTHGNAALKTILDTTGVVLTAAGITAIWDKLLTGITTVGSIGKLIKDYLDAAISSRSSHDAAAVKTAIEAAGSHLALIKAKTDLGLENTTWTDAKAAYLDEAISAAKTLTAAYDAAKTAAQAGDEMDLIDAPNATALTALAVAILDCLLSEGDADALNARTVRSALRALRNKSAIAAGTLTVCKENDSDAAWTAAATTDPAAEPITEIDPA